MEYKPHIGYKYISEKEKKEIDETYTKVSYKTIKDIRDPKYQWETVVVNGNDAKYGRFVISKKFKIVRGQTAGEFYGK